jgi:hypothetical protein
MKSGGLANFFPAAGCEPVGRGQGAGVFGQHAGKAGEHVGEILLGIDAEATAVFDDGVKDGTFSSRLFITEERKRSTEPHYPATAVWA